MSTLYIVATPIGNLEDISGRALRVLGEVNFVLAEDTRVTKKLLNRYEITTDVIRYDEHRHKATQDLVLEALTEGSSIALVTDAGTPAISDPGHRLVRRVLDLSHELTDLKVVSIPGPSSVTSALSISGISSDKFIFYGFLPHKKGRETIFKAIGESDITSVILESPHRVEKTLNSLKEHIDWERRISVAREITKIHEQVVSGNIREIIDYFDQNKDKVRGEFVLVIEGRD